MSDSKIIEDFYKNDQGIKFYKNINNSIKELWPDITNENIIIIGYGSPYIDSFNKNNNVITINCFDSFSFPVEYADRVILVHAIEYNEQPSLLLREIWRIIKTNGKLLVIAPNKHGQFYNSKDPIFNHANFFTVNKLISMLDDSLFEPLRIRATLFSSYNFNESFPNVAKFFDNICDKWLVLFGGILLVEGEKKLVIATNKHRLKKKLSFKKKLQRMNNIKG